MTDRVMRTDVQMQIVARDGMVHLLFSEKDSAGELVPCYTSNFSIAAGEALDILVPRLADLAFEADAGLKPAGNVVKAELINRHRKTLTDRLSLILNDKRERRTTSNRALARILVDVCLSEIFS